MLNTKSGLYSNNKLIHLKFLSASILLISYSLDKVLQIESIVNSESNLFHTQIDFYLNYIIMQSFSLFFSLFKPKAKK